MLSPCQTVPASVAKRVGVSHGILLHCRAVPAYFSQPVGRSEVSWVRSVCTPTLSMLQS